MRVGMWVRVGACACRRVRSCVYVGVCCVGVGGGGYVCRCV